MKTRKKRADEETVAQGLATDVRQAAALILSAAVVAEFEGNEWRVEKAGEVLPDGVVLRRKTASLFVSRGGDKLLSAIVALDLKLAFQSQRILDVGASTGGFTDCVLSLGAKEVVAVDVGSNQLAWRLRQDERVTALEKTHICDADSQELGSFDWILADISFNSLARLLPCLIRFSKINTKCLLLVKPQFELKRRDVPQGGVVTNDKDREKAIASVKEAMALVGFTIRGVVESGLAGRTGNREVFIFGELLSVLAL